MDVVRVHLLLVVILSVIWTSACVAAVNPGLKGRITQSGLDYLRDVGLQTLKAEVERMKIPDINGNAHVPVIGGISYTVSNIHITSFDIPSASLTTKTGVGLTLQASGISLSASGNWHYSNHGFIHISDSGSFDATVSSTSLVLTLRIGTDKSGRPTINTDTGDCSFNVGNVHIKLHGGASWLYNLFAGKIADALKSSINQQTCTLIIKEVNVDLQKQLAKMKTEAAIDPHAVIDYSFVAPPTFSGYIETSHKGEVFATGKPHTEAPFTVPVIPPDPDVSRHIFLWITDYMLETAGYVYYEADMLAYNVTQDKLPPGFKYSLNTSEFAVKLLVPQLSSLYPNMPMQINVKATAPPAVDIGPLHINASVKLELDVFVIMKNKSLTFVFALDAVVHGSTVLGCEESATGNILTWKSDLVDVDVTLKRSAIGKFDIKVLSGGVDFACRFLLIPWLNDEGKKGLPLPNGKNIKFEKPVIHQGKGFVKLGTDILYTPSEDID